MTTPSAPGDDRGRATAARRRGPTIHSVVMDERTTDLFQMLDRDVRGRLDVFALPFIATLEEAVRQAYIRGVRDGFQQGALAAERRAAS